MQLELRVEKVKYIDLSEEDAQKILTEVENQEGSNKIFCLLRYHEKLEYAYKKIFGKPSVEDDEILNDWFINPKNKA